MPVVTVENTPAAAAPPPPSPVAEPAPDVDLIPNLWLIGVVGIPFLIVGLTGGWNETFQTGGASAFICGLIVAAVAENLIQLTEAKFSRWREMFVATGDAPSFYVALGLFVWNGWIALTAHTVAKPQVTGMQLSAFLLAAVLLPFIRFAFTRYDVTSSAAVSAPSHRT